MTEETDNPYVNLVTEVMVVPHTRNRQEEIDKLNLKIEYMTTMLYRMVNKLGIEYVEIRSNIEDIERM